MQAVMLCRFQRLQPNLRVTSTHLRAVVTGLLTSTSDSASNGKERLVVKARHVSLARTPRSTLPLCCGV
jgi:hypothetical protein